MIGEFDLIERYFAPLAGPEGLGLKDDAAFYTPPENSDIVISKDMLVAGVHFFEDDAASDIAKKALAVNLSDLAAKGAKPVGYFLGLILNEKTDEQWVKDFAEGLESMQEAYGLNLFGGDTVKTSGPFGVSITILGVVDKGKGVRRSTAEVGDLVFVTGTIGDAALGLKQRRGKLKIPNHQLLRCYLYPVPCQLLGQKLPDVASAALDISDGLIADAEHLAKASGVSLSIEAEKIPYSDDVTAFIKTHPLAREWALTGGDDYELLITCSPKKEKLLLSLAQEVGVKLTRIGYVKQGLGVKVLDEKGQALHFKEEGYKHF